VGDDKRCSSTTQRLKAILNQSFALTIKTRSGFIQNENLWFSENCASDCYSLTLATGEFDSTFANYRVVTVSKTVDEFFAVCDATRRYNFFTRGMWM
jgi:hypothetical protein